MAFSVFGSKLSLVLGLLQKDVLAGKTGTLTENLKSFGTFSELLSLNILLFAKVLSEVPQAPMHGQRIKVLSFFTCWLHIIFRDTGNF